MRKFNSGMIGMPFEGITMSRAERFFIGLTVACFAMLAATLGLAALIWVGAIAGN